MVPLAGVMGAGMPELKVLVPMLLEPIGALLTDVVPDEEVPVEGAAAEGGTTVVFVVSSFLLQAPRASKAVRATDVTARVLIFELNMRISW